MEINADLNQSAHLSASNFVWHPSPLSGVERVMLDRVGDEVAVATSIVRYAPVSAFDPHQHALGEEFIVLEGVFSDEHGDFPAGSYVRNPPGTGHTPHSDEGCVIWVKLRQFADDDLQPLVAEIDANAPAGVVQTLHEYADEVVSYVRIAAGERFAFDASFFTRELLVLEGQLTWQQAETYTLDKWSWIRMHSGQPLRVNVLTDCLVFTKTRPVYRATD